MGPAQGALTADTRKSRRTDTASRLADRSFPALRTPGPLTVTALPYQKKRCRAASGARAAGGPALRPGLPPNDLGFSSHGLTSPAEAVSEPAGNRRSPASLCVITGFMSAYREFLVTANKR